MKITGFQDTIDWYNQNAQQYADKSRDRISMDEVEAFIAELPNSEQGAILDAGCGQGKYTQVFQDRGFEATGLDISSGLLEVARQDYPDCTFVEGDLRKLPFETSSFDGIWAHASLLHLETVEEVQQVLSEFHRVLKAGGIVHIRVKAQTGAQKTAVVSDALSGHERFFQYFTESELVELVEEAGFTVLAHQQYNETKRQRATARPEVEWLVLLARKK